jgi:hypothetical protein
VAASRKGYQHGPTPCRKCFPRGTGESVLLGTLKLHNNPGYYGSSNPQVLVLGFSKGTNQMRASPRGGLDHVAFSGARPTLKRILQALGLIDRTADMDRLLTGAESVFGFASLVRCSLQDASTGSSGDLPRRVFKERLALPVAKACANEFLAPLPPSVKVVVLLGTSDQYIKNTMRVIGGLYRDFAEVNSVAFTAGGALWVYATHPSGENRHLNEWLNDPPTTTAGRKRADAVEALAARSLGHRRFSRA